MDDQMQLLANSYAANDSTPALQPLADQSVFKWGAFIVQIWSPDGRLLASSWPQAAPCRCKPSPACATCAPAPAATRLARLHRRAGHAGRRSRACRSRRAAASCATRSPHRALFAALPIAAPAAASRWRCCGWWCGSARTRCTRWRARWRRRTSAASPSSRWRACRTRSRRWSTAFNSLLARLRDAFATQRRFVQDAAHELRTPVAAIGLQLENLRAHVPAGDARRALRAARGRRHARPAPDRAAAAPVAPGERGAGRGAEQVDVRRAAAREPGPADGGGGPAPHRRRLRRHGGAAWSAPPRPSCAACSTT